MPGNGAVKIEASRLTLATSPVESWLVYQNMSARTIYFIHLKAWKGSFALLLYVAVVIE